MKDANIQPKNAKSKYVYDYPGNREVSKHLSWEDKQLICSRTGFSIVYVRQWCQGRRRSRPIDEWARKIMKLNIAKHRKLNQSTDPSTN
jgi:hypothetical protein